MNLIRSVCLIALALCSACSRSGEEDLLAAKVDAWMQAQDSYRVLCTTGMIEDIVAQIGGEQISTLTLIHRELDPHTYELVKGDDEKLSYADLIFANGLELEHGPSLRGFLESSDKVVHLGDRLQKLNPAAIIYVDGLPDPHIWTDVQLWSRTVPVIAQRLSEELPDYSSLFHERAEKVISKMSTADAEIYAEMQSIPDEKRFLVTSHDAFNYFTRRYLAAPNELPSDWDVRFEAPEGLAPEAQLSPVDIERIIQHMARYRVTVLFPESNVSQDSLKKIVQAGRERGLQIYLAQTTLYADAMGGPGSPGDSYLKMARHNAETIARYLKENGISIAKDK